MCGICGIFSQEQAAVDSSIALMNDIQELRGPDERGNSTVRTGAYTCRLGHTRLAIIDRAGGTQPMTSPDSGVSLVHNGEIYNHHRLRKELETAGYLFVSRSDTEVLLHGYHAWGIEGLLQRIDGMFAFALADPAQGRIILARDPAGQKPLYYTEERGKAFAFASTLQALASLPWFDRQIDHDAVELFLNLRVIPAPYSIYRSTRKLTPGSYLVHDGSTTTIKEYWSPLTIQPNTADSDESTLLETYRDILSSSLAETLIADEPVSLLLSSGIDSASLACALAKLPEMASITAFTVSFSAKGYDESAAAASIARHLGLRHQLLKFDGDSFAEQVATIGRIADEPFGDPGILPALQLSRAVASSSRVAIGGDGADELFGGYQTFGILPFWPLLKRFPGFFRHVGKVAQRTLPFTGVPHPLGTKIRRFSHGLGMPDHLAFAHWLCVFSPEETARLLDKPGTTLFNNFVTNRLAGLTDKDPVTVMCKSYFRLFLPGVLEKMDRAAMNYSLETRAPFLQRRMIEFALSLPPRFKIRPGSTKYLLRKSLSTCLPGEIVRAGKKGFLPPLADEFAGDWGAGISGTLAAACSNFGIDHKRIMTMLDDHRKLRCDHSSQLWLIYQLGLFLQSSSRSTVSAPRSGEKPLPAHRRESAS